MRIEASTDSLCLACLECLKHCPASSTQLGVLKCRHCEPGKAACARACPRNCYYETASGVLAIDEDKCVACGRCVDACPWNAIVFNEVTGKASKCDLCAGKGLDPSCVRTCKKAKTVLMETVEEKNKADTLLGYRVEKVSGRILWEGKRFTVVEDKEKTERVYCLKVRELSLQEAALVRDFSWKYKRESVEGTVKGMKGFFEQYLTGEGLSLDSEQKGYLLEHVRLLCLEEGPLSYLFEDNEIEEITVNGVGAEKPVRVYVRGQGWLKTNLCFYSASLVKALVNRMSMHLGRRLSTQEPRLSAVTEKGERIQGTIEPVSFYGPSVTIRKFKRQGFSVGELIANKTLSSELAAFMWMAMHTDCNLLIAGNTGSGKTTLLNSFFSLVPARERIVVVEETPEIAVPQEHVVKMSEEKSLGIGLNELIYDSLRMRPDRIIVGEVRNEPEAKAFVNTILAGQGKGSYCTFHALNSREALQRMQGLGVQENDLKALDLVLVIKRWDNHKGEQYRRVVEIAEVNDMEGLSLNRLYSYDHKRGKLERAGGSCRVYEKISRSFSLEGPGLEEELAKRKSFLERLASERVGGREFYERIQEH